MACEESKQLRFLRRTGGWFEIPEEWLAGTDVFDWVRRPKQKSSYEAICPPYPSDPQGALPEVASVIVLISCIEPVTRTLSETGTPFESREKVLAILTAMSKNEPLPPVRLRECVDERYEFELLNGQHRLLLSEAAGFTHIPAIVFPRTKHGPQILEPFC